MKHVLLLCCCLLTALWLPAQVSAGAEAAAESPRQWQETPEQPAQVFSAAVEARVQRLQDKLEKRLRKLSRKPAWDDGTGKGTGWAVITIGLILILIGLVVPLLSTATIQVWLTVFGVAAVLLGAFLLLWYYA